MSRPVTTVSGETLDRALVEALLAEDVLLVLEDCDLTGVDFSRLHLQDCAFVRCSVSEASSYAANLARTRWQRWGLSFEDCLLVGADLRGLDFGFRPVCSPLAGAGTLAASTQARSYMI
jgi:uncharacterized protein YjbI with pentapeptide repeats